MRSSSSACPWLPLAERTDNPYPSPTSTTSSDDRTAMAGKRVPDLYKTLGVSTDADKGAIKKAYRRLATKHHPDKPGGDAERFKEIEFAHRILSNDEKRAEYDRERSGTTAAPSRSSGVPTGDPFDFRGFTSIFDEWNDFLKQSTAAKDEVPSEEEPAKSDAQSARTAGEEKLRASDGSVLIQRDGHTYADVRVSFDQAILGSSVVVPTLTGTSRIRIQPGTSSGTKLRIPNQGPEGPEGRGHHYVTVHIDVPKRIDGTAEKLLHDLMREIGRSGN